MNAILQYIYTSLWGGVRFDLIVFDQASKPCELV